MRAPNSWLVRVVETQFIDCRWLFWGRKTDGSLWLRVRSSAPSYLLQYEHQLSDAGTSLAGWLVISVLILQYILIKGCTICVCSVQLGCWKNVSYVFTGCPKYPNILCLGPIFQQRAICCMIYEYIGTFVTQNVKPESWPYMGYEVMIHVRGCMHVLIWLT